MSKDWERADEVARELGTAPHVDQVKGITPTGGKKKYSPLSFVDKDTNFERAKDVAEPSNRGDEPIVAPVEGIDSVLNSTKAISSMDMDRVSETDSQATIPSANQETATALTDSIPSLISNSQSTNPDQQVKAPRRRSNDIKSRSSRVEVGEVEAALPASQSSDNLPPPALRRG